MKKITSITLVILFVMFTGFSCSEENTITTPQTTDNFLEPNEEYADIVAKTNILEEDSLSAEEIEDLIFMREEEKLARDVYIKFFQLYSIRPFSKIARSEASHMRAILFLLNRYGIEDPVGDNEVGEFTNPELAELYTQLIATGSQNEIEALKVGAAIEEIDILDLIEAMENSDNPDIDFVYSRLLRASGFHLRSFVWNLHVRGVEYVPQYLTIEEFNRILGR